VNIKIIEETIHAARSGDQVSLALIAEAEKAARNGNPVAAQAIAYVRQYTAIHTADAIPGFGVESTPPNWLNINDPVAAELWAAYQNGLGPMPTEQQIADINASNAANAGFGNDPSLPNIRSLLEEVVEVISAGYPTADVQKVLAKNTKALLTNPMLVRTLTNDRAMGRVHYLHELATKYPPTADIRRTIFVALQETLPTISQFNGDSEIGNDPSLQILPGAPNIRSLIGEVIARISAGYQTVDVQKVLAKYTKMILNPSWKSAFTDESARARVRHLRDLALKYPPNGLVRQTILSELQKILPMVSQFNGDASLQTSDSNIAVPLGVGASPNVLPDGTPAPLPPPAATGEYGTWKLSDQLLMALLDTPAVQADGATQEILQNITDAAESGQDPDPVLVNALADRAAIIASGMVDANGNAPTFGGPSNLIIAASGQSAAVPPAPVPPAPSPTTDDVMAALLAIQGSPGFGAARGEHRHDARPIHHGTAHPHHPGPHRLPPGFKLPPGAIHLKPGQLSPGFKRAATAKKLPSQQTARQSVGQQLQQAFNSQPTQTPAQNTNAKSPAMQAAASEIRSQAIATGRKYGVHPDVAIATANAQSNVHGDAPPLRSMFRAIYQSATDPAVSDIWLRNQVMTIVNSCFPNGRFPAVRTPPVAALGAIFALSLKPGINNCYPGDSRNQIAQLSYNALSSPVVVNFGPNGIEAMDTREMVNLRNLAQAVKLSHAEPLRAIDVGQMSASFGTEGGRRRFLEGVRNPTAPVRPSPRLSRVDVACIRSGQCVGMANKYQMARMPGVSLAVLSPAVAREIERR